MIRKLTFLLLIVSLAASCREKSAEISGILEKPLPGEYIFLDELSSNKLVTVDSVMVSEDGRFEFSRDVKSPSFYLLKINENNFLTMLIEPGEKIKMTSHNDSLNYPVAIIGSKGTRLMADYNKTLRKTIEKLKGLSDIYDRNSGRADRASLIDSLDNLSRSYLSEINTYTKNYIDRNLPSLVCLVALYQQVAPNVYVIDPGRDISYFEKVDSSLYSRYPEYGPVVTLHEQVAKLTASIREKAATQPGTGNEMTAPEISLPSPGGDTIRLSSTRGSIVMLDFWASWCPPCRSESPNLVKAYRTYHSRGFQIYQVSLDKTKEAWIKGIEEDKLGQWINVSDVKYWNSVVVALYNIESIPANFLLDRDGRVIATNLRGEALQRKLAELFTKD